MTSHFSILLAQGDQQGGSNQTVISLVTLVLVVLVIAGFWRVFSKAGQPGWGCLIPFYNIYLLCKVAGKPGWWMLLFFIPLVNFVIIIIVAIGVAENFGKGIWLRTWTDLLPLYLLPHSRVWKC